MILTYTSVSQSSHIVYSTYQSCLHAQTVYLILVTKQTQGVLLKAVSLLWQRVHECWGGYWLLMCPRGQSVWQGHDAEGGRAR